MSSSATASQPDKVLLDGMANLNVETGTTSEPNKGTFRSTNTATSSQKEDNMSLAEKRERALKDRALKRARKSAENREKAERHVKAGDKFTSKNDFQSALNEYSEAVSLCNTTLEYYMKLAEVYSKMDCYLKVESALSRALTLVPNHVEARHRRGVARMEEGLLHAAKIDFKNVLKLSPTYAPTLAALQIVSYVASNSTIGGPDSIDMVLKDQVDFESPLIDSDPLDVDEIEKMSDSSDCNHVGNGVPCRFYNHDGCGRGSSCAYSHAPDDKSVRDDLGRNVCIYYLFGSCKFGSSKCVYAHERDYLPENGWWTDEEETELSKMAFEIQRKKMEQRALDEILSKMVLTESKSEGKKKVDKKVEVATKNTSKGATKNRKKKSKAGGKNKGAPSIDINFLLNTLASDTESEVEQRMENCGFTDDEVNELLCQGVKPWDDDAWDVLQALSCY